MTADLLDLPLPALLAQARQIRDDAHGRRVTFSPKVFIPLTMLCRDKCGYCTFAQPPARLESPFLSPDEVLAIARAGAAAGCHEALFTLGERPELRYPVAAEWLDGQWLRLDGRLPRRDGEARRRPDRIAAPRERRRAVRRGARRAPSRRPGPGDDARVTRATTSTAIAALPTRRQSGASRRSTPRASSRSPSRPASSSASARPEPTASSRSRRSRRRIGSTATCKR